jgi:hypothetical protein
MDWWPWLHKFPLPAVAETTGARVPLETPLPYFKFFIIPLELFYTIPAHGPAILLAI